jgi:hypothetical protein
MDVQIRRLPEQPLHERDVGHDGCGDVGVGVLVQTQSQEGDVQLLLGLRADFAQDVRDHRMVIIGLLHLHRIERSNSVHAINNVLLEAFGVHLCLDSFRKCEAADSGDGIWCDPAVCQQVPRGWEIKPTERLGSKTDPMETFNYHTKQLPWTVLETTQQLRRFNRMIPPGRFYLPQLAKTLGLSNETCVVRKTKTGPDKNIPPMVEIKPTRLKQWMRT